MTIERNSIAQLAAEFAEIGQLPLIKGAFKYLKEELNNKNLRNDVNTLKDKVKRLEDKLYLNSLIIDKENHKEDLDKS